MAGIPDQSCASTVLVNWQNDQTLSCPEQTDETWSADLELFANPVGFWNAKTVPDANSQSVVFVTGLNTQLGASWQSAYDNFRSSYQRWRIAYYSATVYYDAPALADQGSVVASQFPLEGAFAGGPALVVSGEEARYCRYKVGYFGAEDAPSFEKLLTMPNAYSGLAKEGVYLPLRLDSNHSTWRCDADTFIEQSFPTVGDMTYSIVSTSGDTGCRLYPNNKGLSFDPALNIFRGTATPGMCSGIAGQISFRNLSKQGRLRVVIRAGYECMASPGTSMTPFLAVSPPYDPAAITAYYQISRELKDAYPADYNDLGKLWEVIKRVASVVAPALPAPVRMIGSVVGSLIDKRVDRSRDERAMQPLKATPRDAPPAATMERIQKLNASKLAGARRTIARRR